MLESSHEPLDQRYDLVMLDLDGVVYIGGAAVPGAATHLAHTRASGPRLAFITNNASRTPETVAAQLRSLGVEALADDVVTSAQAASRLLLERFGAGARVVLLGAEGLRAALESDGLVPVGVEDDAVALATGYGPDVLWRDVMRAAVRVRDGLPWVASNTDMSIPTAYGVAPGHGVLVETIRRFADVGPLVAGKPERPLLDETVRRVGGARPLMVGDRLDTDIEGARRLGIDSLLVLTGVTGLAELVSAPVPMRPTFIGTDLGALGTPHEAPQSVDGRAVLGGWTAGVEDGRLVVHGEGDAEAWWRVVATVAWAHLDATGVVIDTAGLTAPAPGPAGPQR
ncbi:HAD-IIA family hydrolase [Nocardioides sp. dk4132]|uniref:HAD-IIA family hydrolase n=1 Tax=unclassified Nocardioides TaxID=2615069 RepID=UPI001296BF2A|nr:MULTISPECIES: HAD-IIA family hydrolase [unclassified Nocardioides]MQW75354.1 HAD-IIA family hydrolase [Nocardioides sp. dk4132]QGA07501.1 HAD-IIA family hydrolase [Nocardioides sp. dk884]